MASHSELRPDDAALPLLIASAALSKAESRLTVATGTVVAENADGTQTWIGANGSDDANGVIRWVGDLSAPGRPLGLSAACSMQCVVVSWDGTLDGGIPSDFAYVEIFARREGSVDDVVSWGRLSSAGMLMSPRYDIGTVFDVYAIAYDDAHDSTGMLARNRSEQSDLITVAVEQDADMGQIDAAVEEMSRKADEAGAKAEQVRKDMQSEVDDVRAKVDGQITDIRGTVNGQQSKLDEFGQKLEGVVTQNGATVNSLTELRQTVSGLDARVSQNTETAEGAMGKATTLEQTASSLSTKISEHATTLNATVKTANEAKSTADSNKQTISQVSQTASGALTKATTVEANLNGFKTTVSETYQAKADMSSYSTKSYVDETSKSVALGVVQDYKGADGSGLATKSDISVSKTEITSEVSNTYATKDGVSKEISSKITQNNSSLEVKFSNAGSIEYVTNGSFRENLDGWTVDDGQWVINGGNNALQYYKAVSANAGILGPRQDPSVLMGTSTRQRLIRRSFDIANYSNASSATLRMSCRLNDGTWSGEYPSVELDSTFDWMHVDMVETIPAGKYIDRVVPVIRATNACMVNVEVRNFSLRDITDSYKSADAVINMTGQGVRVGKNKNGAWTGMSALVGTGGTFDILDEHGERMLEMSDTGLRLPVLKNNTAFKIGRYHHPTYDSDVVYIGDDYDSNVDSPARIEFNRNSINLTARLLNMNLTDSLFYVNGHPMGKASDIKQSQRWSNINMQAWNFGNLGIVNILHPSGTNAHIMGNDDPTEIGRISPLNAPRDYVGCTLAAYGNTTLFAEVTPAGLVKCFTAFGGQHDWDYFTGTIVFPLTW